MVVVVAAEEASGVEEEELGKCYSCVDMRCYVHIHIKIISLFCLSSIIFYR